ncbi:hypothetical protein X975_07853, partial [Stegodyphus mimosarum]
MEKLTNRKLISIHTDNGSEICNGQFERYLAKCGISVEYTNAYVPGENGVWERFDQMALDAVKAVMIVKWEKDGEQKLLNVSYIHGAGCVVRVTEPLMKRFSIENPTLFILKYLLVKSMLAYQNKIEINYK